ncbi:hypothetical protein J2S89_002759 [Arthrobacter bambusae]|nr:hypothetical protein [Arthrobacter bambusae]MDQ0099285.1 hypothetical protein [Arthrobacter bambusae]
MSATLKLSHRSIGMEVRRGSQPAGWLSTEGDVDDAAFGGF